MLSDTIVRLIRTYTPLVIGAVLVALGRAIGIQIDSAAGVTVILPIVVAAYWSLIKILEHQWPALGWLLGVPLTKAAPLVPDMPPPPPK